MKLGRRLFLILNLATAAALVGHRFYTKLLHPSDGGGSRGRFRVYNVADKIPSPEDWHLEVTGEVRGPLKLKLDELISLPRTELKRDFTCVVGWKVRNVKWEGVSLKTIAAVAGALAESKFINFYSSDGVYTESLTMEQAMKEDVLLAYKMNDETLKPEHGAPLRLVVPQMYGYKSIKWVNRVEFSRGPLIGYWELRGYPADADIERT
jgi:DMSO/TMAO reductase YedYZ molybdopterin-dependent catalytic subunit